MATVLEKFLGQLTNLDLTENPNGVPLVVGQSALTVMAKNIVVCNTGAAEASFSIHFSDNGSSATTANALFFNQKIRGDSTVQIDTFVVLENTSHILTVKTDDNALTFTAFGATIT